MDLLATLVAGLRAESRTKMAINGAKAPINTMILAMIYDCLNRWVWMHSKDGAHKRNEPKSLTKAILAEPVSEKHDIEAFESGEDFEKARARIIGES